MSVSVATGDVGAGPPVVLLHGQPGSGADWGPVVDRLWPRHRVITPDRPGYGATGGPAGGIGDNADAVASLLDQLDIGPATVAGHSWGGGVALMLAHRHPERVRGLVLVASVGHVFQPSLLDRVLAFPGAGPALTIGGLQVLSRALAVPRVRRVLGHDVAVLDDDGARLLTGSLRHPGVWRAFVREQRALFEETALLADAVASLRTPAAVVQGDADSLVPAGWARALARDLRDARLIEVPHAGHMLPLEVPDVVAAAIDETARVAAAVA